LAIPQGNYVNTETQESLRRVIDMYLHDEERHFNETGYPRDHIYRDLLRLRDYMTCASTMRDLRKAAFDTAIAHANEVLTEIRNHHL